MYDLVYNKELKNWIVVMKNGGSFRGNLGEVANYCIYYLNFDLKEIDRGLDELIQNDHDTAHFGFRKTFLCSFDSAKRKVIDYGVVGTFH